MIILRNIKQRIKNLIKWFPVIWKDQDWDHCYFHIIMRKKLSNMENHFRNYGHHTQSKKDANDIKLCIVLLDRIINDVYDEMVYKNHDKKWGDSHFKWTSVNNNSDLSEVNITRDNVKTEKDRKTESKEFKKLLSNETELRQQDINYLYATLNNHILNWWD